VIAAVAAALMVFYLYVMLRGPRDYTGELARLLPARTSAFVALNDFEGIRRRIAETHLYRQLSESIDLASLLMTNEDWRHYQENKDSVEWKAKAALAREFLRRYFSRQFVVALSRLDRCDDPALLVMASTDLGFAEKLGELCAQLYPELHLATEKHRGIPLYAYEAPQSRRSFTYVRFGKTVVLSLRTNERDYLRRIIDWRLDAPTGSLFETADFQRVWQSPARRQGLVAVARPGALLGDLVGRPEFNLRSFFAKRKHAWIRNITGDFRFLEAAVTVSERIEIRLAARSPETTAPLGKTTPPAKPLTLLDTVSSGCIAFADFHFENLAEALARVLNIQQAFGAEVADPKALAAAVERLNVQWGFDVSGDLGPALGREAVLAVHDVQLPMMIVASLLIPATDATRAQAIVGRLVKTYADLNRIGGAPKAFQNVADFHPLYSTPLGFLGVGWLGERLVLGTSPNSYLATRRLIEAKGEPITRNPIFQSLALPMREPADAMVFVNLEEIGRRAEGLLTVMALLSKSVRAKSAMYGKIVGVLKLLRGVGLTAQCNGGDWTYVLRVPAQ
jgi:hypothetical protein